MNFDVGAKHLATDAVVYSNPLCGMALSGYNVGCDLPLRAVVDIIQGHLLWKATIRTADARADRSAAGATPPIVDAAVPYSADLPLASHRSPIHTMESMAARRVGRQSTRRS